MNLRTGRKVGRTIYAMVGRAPSDDDVLIGVMDTPELAEFVVQAANALPHDHSEAMPGRPQGNCLRCRLSRAAASGETRSDQQEHEETNG